MKIINENIKLGKQFKFFEFSRLIYVSFLISILCFGCFVSSQISKPKNQKIHHKFFQDSRRASDGKILFAHDALEESEPTDESSNEKIVDTNHSICLRKSFQQSILTSSFANFSQSLQKRTSIPFFLLHHSLKIPAA